jgi:hypothetical protein
MSGTQHDPSVASAGPPTSSLVGLARLRAGMSQGWSPKMPPERPNHGAHRLCVSFLGSAHLGLSQTRRSRVARGTYVRRGPEGSRPAAPLPAAPIS